MTHSVTFSALSPIRTRQGPESNTGQKGRDAAVVGALAPPLIDWCSITFPAGALKATGCSDYHQFLAQVYGTKGRIFLGEIQQKTWNFFPWSGLMIDGTGALAGRIGLNDKGEVHISLTGQGCRHVEDWKPVRAAVEKLGARITRLDIAVDDFAGSRINLDTFAALVDSGSFDSNGRPPDCQHVHSTNSKKGDTLYIGSRGYKQLCIYEKGKQLGHSDSSYCRAELRLYNKHHVIAAESLTDPGVFFKGAYECLAQFIDGEMQRLEVKERQSEPSAYAMFEALKRQSGKTIGTLVKAFSEEALVDLIRKHIARDGRPRRFQHFNGDLPTYLRQHIEATTQQQDCQP